jgi:hypothetical protein
METSQETKKKAEISFPCWRERESILEAPLSESGFVPRIEMAASFPRRLSGRQTHVQWERRMPQASVLQSDIFLIQVLCNLANSNFIG